jgi:branched-chain amino acid transport system substrate-binding protein
LKYPLLLRAYIFLSLFTLALPSSVLAEDFKIGVSLPLTGPASGYGEDIRRALEFANKKYAQGKVELLFQDDKCSGKDALDIARRFTSIDKVDIAIQGGCSGSLITAAPIYQNAGTIVFGVATSAPAISKLGDRVFRMSPNDTEAGEILAKEVINNDEDSLGIISEQTEYCEAFREEFAKHLGRADIPVSEAVFTSGESDFRASLLKLRTKSPEAIFINTQSERTFANIGKQIEEMRWDPQIYGAYWPSSSFVLESLGDFANGIVFVDLASPKTVLSKDGMTDYQEFLKEYGNPVSNPVVPPLAIDTFRIAFAALSSSADHSSFLTKNEFTGVLGKLRFDQHGDLQNAPLSLARIEKGKALTMQ